MLSCSAVVEFSEGAYVLSFSAAKILTGVYMLPKEGINRRPWSIVDNVGNWSRAGWPEIGWCFEDNVGPLELHKFLQKFE